MSTSTKSTTVERPNNKPCRIVKGIAFKMLLYILVTLRKYVDIIIDMVFGFVWEKQKQSLPELDSRHNILLESAVSLAAKIRNKELKSEDLVKTCIERIKIVNPILNAVTDTRYNEALADARQIDEQIAVGLSEEYFKDKPFLGVPFTTKESHAVLGLHQTMGLSSRAHLRAAEDAECVALLRRAGAIPLAVTNVPEVNKWQETRNLVFGQTNNPYHAGRTVGGSSGGEAALTAAIATPISLCSDIGGSTRMPAFFCGLYALNPTAGHTNVKGLCFRTGLAPTMASIGFVSRHVEDLAPLTRIVAGDKAADLGLERRLPVKEIKFYYTEECQDMRVSPVSRDLRDAMKRVIQHLSAEASTTAGPTQYYHEGFNHMFALWKHGMTLEAEVFGEVLTNKTGEAKAVVELPKKLVGLSNYTLASILKLADDQVLPAVDPQWAEKLTKELKEDLVSKLGTTGVLLFPSAPFPAPYHYALYLRPFSFAYWAVFNALHLPAAQVPLGLNSEGIPIGIQVVAGPKQEGLCLSVAEYLAKQFGGCPPPCKIASE